MHYEIETILLLFFLLPGTEGVGVVVETETGTLRSATEEAEDRYQLH